MKKFYVEPIKICQNYSPINIIHAFKLGKESSISNIKKQNINNSKIYKIMSIHILRKIPKEQVYSMELFNFSHINHHSFMRWTEEEKKKDERTDKVFNPGSLPEDDMDRAFMVTALSA